MPYKEGTIEKLGEGGPRSVIGMKKWQERNFTANEVFFTWHSYDKSSKQDELKGKMRIAEMDDVAPVTIKGREHTFTVSGTHLPHSYSFATKTRGERKLTSNLPLLAVYGPIMTQISCENRRSVGACAPPAASPGGRSARSPPGSPRPTRRDSPRAHRTCQIRTGCPCGSASAIVSGTGAH